MKTAISQLTTRPPFEGLFATDPRCSPKIAASMKAEGYDVTQPVYVWKDPAGVLLVVDGHTRLDAAKAAELTEIHVVVRRFTDEGAAFDFAVKNQRARRNITKQQIIEAVARAEIAKPNGSSPPVTKNPKGGRPRDHVRQAAVAKAVELGASPTTADRAVAKVKAEEAAANGEPPKPKKVRAKPKLTPERAEDLKANAALVRDAGERVGLAAAGKPVENVSGDIVNHGPLKSNGQTRVGPPLGSLIDDFTGTVSEQIKPIHERGRYGLERVTDSEEQLERWIGRLTHDRDELSWLIRELRKALSYQRSQR